MSRRRKDGARTAGPARASSASKSWLDHLLFWRRKKTAQTAKQRLMAVLEAERATRGGGTRLPEYLPALQRELVRVVSKYAKVPSKEVRVRVERRRHGDGVELKVELPGAAGA